MKNPLSINISFYSGIKSVEPIEVNLFDILTTDNYRKEVMAIRQESDVEKQKNMKNELPLFTPSGLFSRADASSLIKPSGLIGIDIDKKDNLNIEDFSQLKEKIGVVPYILYCGWSVRGEGYFCIMQIADSNKLKEHFQSIQQDFNRSNIIIDKSGSNINRRRYVSYDSEPYINLNAKVYDKYLTNVNRPIPKANIAPYNNEKAKESVENLLDSLELLGIDITENYDDWLKIGFGIANEFGENGRDYFHRISQFNPEYDVDEANKKYSSCLKSKAKDDKPQITIATLFHYAQKHGVIQSAIEKDFGININRS